MVGHVCTADRFQEEEQVTPGQREILRIENLSKAGYFEPLNFTVRAGEIVGLVGSGKEAVCCPSTVTD